MSKLDSLKDLEVIVAERKSLAYKAHMDWMDTRDRFGSNHTRTRDALAKKDACSDILEEAYQELEALQEEIKHG